MTPMITAISPIMPFRVLVLDHEFEHVRMFRRCMAGGKNAVLNLDVQDSMSIPGALGQFRRTQFQWLITRTDLRAPDYFDQLLRWFKDEKREGMLPLRVCLTTWPQASGEVNHFARELGFILGPDHLVVRIPWTYRLPEHLGLIKKEGR